MYRARTGITDRKGEQLGPEGKLVVGCCFHPIHISLVDQTQERGKTGSAHARTRIEQTAPLRTPTTAELKWEQWVGSLIQLSDLPIRLQSGIHLSYTENQE